MMLNKIPKNFWMGFFGVYFAIFVLAIVLDVFIGEYDLAFWKVMTLFFAVLWYLNSQLVDKSHNLLKESGEIIDRMIKLMATVIQENSVLKSRNKSGGVDGIISRSASDSGFKSEPLNLRKNEKTTNQKNG